MFDTAGAYTIRTLRPEHDVPPLARLLAEIEAMDRSGDAPDEEALRESLSWPGHDPARDRWVVEDPGSPSRLIAHSLVWKPPKDAEAELGLAVHPAWRRQGIGTSLLGAALDRARTLGATAVRAYADERHTAATAFLRRHGFVPVAAYTEMRFPAEQSLPAAVFPAGYRLQTYDTLQDIPLLARTMTDSFAGQWGHHVVDPDDLAHWLPDLPPDGIFMLFDSAGEAAGVCRAELRDKDGDLPAGYVDAPGVVPAHRNEPLRIPLLLTAMRWLRDQGIGPIGLESWGDDEGMLTSYRGLGFSMVRREISYRLDL